MNGLGYDGMPCPLPALSYALWEFIGAAAAASGTDEQWDRCLFICLVRETRLIKEQYPSSGGRSSLSLGWVLNVHNYTED